MHDHADSEGWSEAVRRRRTSLDMRQEDVAALAGVSTRFVHAVEAGKPSLQLDKVLAVLEVLGLELRLLGPDVAATVS